MSDIAGRVTEIIVTKLGVDESEVTPDASFTNDLGADSLDTVELIMEFEKEFNLTIDESDAEFEKEFDISIPDDHAENIQTVGQAVEYLSSKVG